MSINIKSLSITAALALTALATCAYASNNMKIGFVNFKKGSVSVSNIHKFNRGNLLGPNGKNKAFTIKGGGINDVFVDITHRYSIGHIDFTVSYMGQQCVIKAHYRYKLALGKAWYYHLQTLRGECGFLSIHKAQHKNPIIDIGSVNTLNQ